MGTGSGSRLGDRLPDAVSVTHRGWRGQAGRDRGQRKTGRISVIGDAWRVPAGSERKEGRRKRENIIIERVGKVMVESRANENNTQYTDRFYRE